MINKQDQEIEFSGVHYSIETGLTTEQAAASREKHGRNELTPPARNPWWQDLLEGFDDPTIKILLAAAALSLMVTAIERYALHNADASFVDSIGVFIAVGLATLVGFFSERKSAKEFEALNKIRDDIPIRVVRDGQLAELHIGDVVVGDVVEIESGDKIPADGTLLQVSGLFVDQSAFTGESEPVRKSATSAAWKDAELRKDASLGSDAFVPRGATVSDGRARFLVTAVGDATEMGKIADALESAALDESETPLVQKLSRLAGQISVVGVTAATIIFTIMNLVNVLHSGLLSDVAQKPGSLALLCVLALAVGYALERFAARPFFKSMGTEISNARTAAAIYIPCALSSGAVLLALWGMAIEHNTSEAIVLVKSILLAFVVAVTIIVVAVPEGLPMMVTVSLALNTRKMARQNCLVRRLVASETIGSATVVCTDKTGTLTKNKMTPVRANVEGHDFDRDQFDDLVGTREWRLLVEGIAVNSHANLHIEPNPNDPDSPIVGNLGNPTECALLNFLRERGVDYHEERKTAARRLFELEHNSDRKFSAVVFEDSDGVAKSLVKGAPERVVSRCSTIYIEGEPKPISDYLDALQKSLEEASEKALRVLAFCEKRLEPQERELFENGTNEEKLNAVSANDYAFVGFLGIADPERAEARDAVKLCQGAGIQVKMITGDAKPTAVAIARNVGILTGAEGELALTSEEFAKVSDDELPEIAKKICVLARSTPSDKLRLVQALHRDGEVVAMTGDGTNDAPALKAADVGLAMGIAGTEVAKEASDIVLVDDNFRSIATGVWWGRSLFQNIRRFLQFQLSVNFVALLAATLGPLVGTPLPLTVTQLLWINIIMDTFAALALSTDPPRPNVMKRKPIPRTANVVTASMCVSILVSGLYQLVILFAALFGGWFVNGAPYSSELSDKENLEPLTIFFTILVMFQFWHKFNCRALLHDESPFALVLKNRMFLGIVLSITALQIVMVQIPFVGEFFRTTPLDLAQWLKIITLTFTIVPVAWLGRLLSFKLGLEKDA